MRTKQDHGVSEAEQALRGRDYRRAHELCIARLQQNPNDAECYFLLGVLAADHENLEKARELIEKSLALGERPGRANAQLARCLIALNRKDEAVAAADRAAAAGPHTALELDTIGVAFSRAGLHDRAAEFYERAVEIEPRNGAFLYNLAASLQFLGRLSDAETRYREAHAAAPKDHRALAAAAQLAKQTPARNDIEALRRVFDQNRDDAEAARQIGHALAKCFEDLGDPAEAMVWLGRAKAGARQRSGFDFRGDAAPLFETSEATLQVGARAGFQDAAPIFVVGLPRTGTTLIDRILSAHPEVRSAGELTDFALHLKRAAGTPSPFVLDVETLKAAPQLDLADVGRRYAEGVSASLGLSGRFVDKMPLNAFYAPLILQALPQARIVCLRRHPADAMLSNYRQLFASGFSYYDYALDLEDAARYAAAFCKLTDAFAERLDPARLTIVRYEDVIEDIEGQTRRLLDFCGVDFDPACVEFHRNAAPVATASSAQVRQPLYRTSVDRWKRYRPAIDGALKILVDEGVLPAQALL
ncbi:MAG: sulfotransferase [Pseudomonadota bacterium]